MTKKPATKTKDKSPTIEITKKNFNLIWAALGFSLLSLAIYSLAPVLKLDELIAQTLSMLCVIGAAIFLGTLCVKSRKN